MKIKMHSVYEHLKDHWAQDGEPYIDVYNDYDCLSGNIPPKSIALLIEPRSIQPRVYDYMEKNYGRFAYVFTHDSKLLEMCENAKPIIWGGGLGGLSEVPATVKTKDVSFVSSNKTMCELHKARLDLANTLKGVSHVDVMGTFDGGEFVGPEKIYQDYMFSIAYENHIDNLWITEKICNCFINRVIPIYIGSPKICEYFNMDGVIQVHDNMQVIKVLDMLNSIGFKRFYELKREAIDDNYRRVHEFDRFEDRFFKEYGGLLDDLHS